MLSARLLGVTMLSVALLGQGGVATQSAAATEPWAGPDPVLGARAFDRVASAQNRLSSAMESVFQRLTEEIRKVLFVARESLARHGGVRLEAEHIALGILEVNPASVARFTEPAWTVTAMKARLSASVVSRERIPESSEESVPVGASLARVLLQAAREADRVGSQDVGLEHVILALARDNGTAGQILREAGVDAEEVARSLRSR